MGKTLAQFETFRPFTSWERHLLSHAPNGYQGTANIRRVRITVVEVEETKEEIEQNLQYAWDFCESADGEKTLRAAAAELGYTLVGPRGGHVR